MKGFKATLICGTDTLKRSFEPMTSTSQPTKSQRVLEAEKRLEQARNALKDARNAENRQKRKIEDRQKIILGGALLKAAESDERFSVCSAAFHNAERLCTHSQPAGAMMKLSSTPVRLA